MSRYRKTFREALNEVYKIKEASDDHEISMARGELEAIADKATQLSSMLKDKSDDENLEAWVQSKITKAKDYVNAVSDYLTYNPGQKQNEETILEFTQQQIKQAYGILNDPRYKGGNYDGAVDAIEKLAKGLSKQKDVANALRRANEEIERSSIEETTSHTVRFTDPLNKKRFAVPYKTHADAEKKMAQLKKDGVKDIKITMDTLKPGVSFKEEYIFEKTYDEKDIDKFHTALDKIVHKHFGHSSDEKKEKEQIKKEEVQLDEFTTKQIKALQMAYGDLQGKTISPEKANALSKQLDKMDLISLKQLVKANIPFVSTIAKNKVYKKTGKFEEVEITEIEDYGLRGTLSDTQLQNIKKVWSKKTKKDVTPAVKAMLAKMDKPTQLAIKLAKINVLSDLIEEKVEENKISDIFKAGKEGESAEEIAKRLKMKVKTVKDILGEKFDNYPTADINKKKQDAYADPKKGEKKIVDPEPKLKQEEKRLYVESIAALKNKAEKTGMPYSILKQVYDRGMAAWKGGHRPGATQQQWALARVNSFVTKSSGTWGGADSDLAKKVKGSK